MERIVLLSEQIADSPSVARTTQLFEDAWDKFRAGEGTRAHAFAQLARYNRVSANAVRARQVRLPKGDDEYEALRVAANYLERLASRHEVIADVSHANSSIS